MSERLLEAIMAAVMTDRGGLFWPVLSCLERLDVEAEALPKRRREAMRATLSEVRETILFDQRKLAVSLADAVERQIAAEQIVSERRSVQPTTADEDARAGGRRGPI